MTPMLLRRLALPAMLLLLGVIPLPVAAATPDAAPSEIGDLWEVTSQMTMEGMPMTMPAHTQKVCTAKEWKEPPAPKNDRQQCETLEFNTTPTKTTWKVRCAGKPPMTGEGAIDRAGPDAYSGKITMTSDDGVMTITLKGKRVSDCDPGSAKH